MNGFDFAGKPLRVGLIGERDPASVGPTLEEMEGAALRLNPQARVQLMANLNRETPLMLPTSPHPTRTILLKNLFDPEEETEPNWPEEIRTDVTEECTKFGAILHSHVEKDSKVCPSITFSLFFSSQVCDNLADDLSRSLSQGFVYLKFQALEGAQGAYQALNGRKFSGRQVVVDYLPEALYNAQFPGSVVG